MKLAKRTVHILLVQKMAIRKETFLKNFFELVPSEFAK